MPNRVTNASINSSNANPPPPPPGQCQTFASLSMPGDEAFVLSIFTRGWALVYPRALGQAFVTTKKDGGCCNLV